MSKVAFLGLGAMGSRMAANLLKAGHTVTVWNRSPAAAEALVASGARKASSRDQRRANAVGPMCHQGDSLWRIPLCVDQLGVTIGHRSACLRKLQQRRTDRIFSLKRLTPGLLAVFSVPARYLDRYP
jgi:NAD binding domain of 6-phosphogluconate dehydrogenase